MAVAFAAYILRWIADWTCSPYSQYCRTASENLSHFYVGVVFFMIMIGATKAKQVKDFFDRVKAVVQLVLNEGSEGGKTKKD
jgi:hypothetical protein